MANVSLLAEGLPKRNLIASYFVSLAIAKGSNTSSQRAGRELHRVDHHTMSIIGKTRPAELLKYAATTRNPRERERRMEEQRIKEI